MKKFISIFSVFFGALLFFSSATPVHAACALVPPAQTSGPASQSFTFTLSDCSSPIGYRYILSTADGQTLTVQDIPMGGTTFTIGNFGGAGTYNVILAEGPTGITLIGSATITITTAQSTIQCGQTLATPPTPENINVVCPQECPAEQFQSSWRCSLLPDAATCTGNSQCKNSRCQQANGTGQFICVTPIPTPTAPVDINPNGVCGRDLYNRRVTFCSLAQLYNNGTAPTYSGCGFGQQCYIGVDTGTGDCNWAVQDNNLLMCFNAPTEAALQNTRIEFQCKSNCGGLLTSALTSGSSTQTIPAGGWPVGRRSDGQYFSCGGGSLSSSLTNASQWQIDVGKLACGAAGTAILTGTVLFPVGGGAIISGLTYVTKLAIAGADYDLVQKCAMALNNYTPVIEARVIQNGAPFCTKQLTMKIDATGVTTDSQNPGDPSPGTVIPSDLGSGRTSFLVQYCNGGNGIVTSIGCIPTTLAGFFKAVFGLAIGIASGIAFLLIIFGGLRIITSAGNPDSMNEGKEVVTAAITGLLLIIFSVFLLRFIGVNVFCIPGFAGGFQC